MADSTDRFHNREADSPEALRKSIDDLAQVVAALDRRLDAATVDLGADVDGARDVTRHLAGDIARLGEALVRRIDGLERNVRSPRRQPRVTSAWIALIVAGLLLAIAGAALFPR